MAVATVAIILPSSLLAFACGRLLTRYETNRAVGLLRQGLAPIAVGLMLASGLVMSRAAYQGVLTLVVVAGMAATVYFTKVSPLWGIAARRDPRYCRPSAAPLRLSARARTGARVVPTVSTAGPALLQRDRQRF